VLLLGCALLAAGCSSSGESAIVIPPVIRRAIQG
jgi:hypothetical protein